MTSRYVLAPEAAQDLVEIWRFIKQQSSEATADRVEICDPGEDCVSLGQSRGGHWRKHLTGSQVKFCPVYSYLIVYRPDTKPLQIVSILHGRRDVERILTNRNS